MFFFLFFFFFFFFFSLEKRSSITCRSLCSIGVLIEGQMVPKFNVTVNVVMVNNTVGGEMGKKMP